VHTQDVIYTVVKVGGRMDCQGPAIEDY